MYTLLLSGFTTLVAAFFGAWCAFLFNNRREKREDEKAMVQAGNSALFSVACQYNTLAGIKKQFIDPCRENEYRFLSMLPILSINYNLPRIKFESLEFLLATKHHSLLLETAIVQEWFQTAIRAIDERSRLHLEEVQIKLQEAEFKQGNEVTMENLENMLGERLLSHIIRATNAAISAVDKAIESNLKIGGDLNSAFIDLFPKHKIVGLEVIEATERQTN